MNEDYNSYPQAGEDDFEAPLVVLIAYIAIGLLFLIFMAALVLAAINIGSPAEEPENKVVVSAFVPTAIGFHDISIPGNDALEVTGNYRRGFTISDGSNGNVIYDSSLMPGNGVLVKLEKSYKSLIFLPKY